jgi:hypothetical protein
MGANCRSTIAVLFAATIVISASCHSDDPPAPGTPGAHIWFESSVKLDVMESGYIGSIFGSPSHSSCSVWSYSRESLTEAQLKVLTAVTLQPFPAGMACTMDGYSYVKASITDRDGTTAIYTDTGCDYLKIPGSTAMLPPRFFVSDFPLGNGQPCP